MKTNSGPVVPKRCPDSARPDSARPCTLPCKRDCVVTPFSEWDSLSFHLSARYHPTALIQNTVLFYLRRHYD
ncbi:hypothetical protein SRHO_G00104530 [Serrasalmus rhombeus]